MSELDSEIGGTTEGVPSFTGESGIVKISGDEDYARLIPGAVYIDPEGKQRLKPIQNDKDYASLPEGSKYIHLSDPENIRQKPSYEGIDYTAQTVHDMALTKNGKKQALELSYPGKVKEDASGELYVDDDGVLRKPGRGIAGTMGHLTAEAAPMGGMLGGMMLGAGAGTAAAPGPGTVGGGVAGMTLGTMGGQAFNNIILRLAGVDEKPSDEVGAIGYSGLGAVGGEVLGRTAALVPAAVVKAKGVVNAGMSKIADFLGVNPETISDVLAIAEHGEKPASGLLSTIRNKLGWTETDTPVRPSASFMEAPKIQLDVETSDPAFRTQKPLQMGETKYTEDKAGELLDALGLQRPESITKPKADVSTQQAGELLQRTALEESRLADEEMQVILRQRKADLEAGIVPQVAQREELLAANQRTQDEAHNLINLALKDVEKGADDALAVLKAGSDTGDFWKIVTQKFQAVRQAIGSNYRRNMTNAYEVAGKEPLSTESLAGLAKDFLETVPKELQDKMPAVTRDMARLTADAESGEGGTATFEQLHKLRTMLREQADYLDLPSDLKNGQFKLFAQKIDSILQSGAEGTDLHLAARMMNANDAWYGKQIGIFDSSEIGAVMKGLKGGEAADPAKLYSTLVKPNNADTINRVHEVVGDNIWTGVRASQKQNWLQRAGTADPDKPDMVKFANEVVSAYHDGTLHAVQGQAEGDRLFKLAQMVHALNGKIDVNVNPGDTAFDIMRRAVRVGEEAKAIGKQDPLGTLTAETAKLERAAKLENAQARRQNPLAFLENKSTGADAAVNRILGNEDLIIAVENRWSRESPQFKALQQVWVEKLLTEGPGIGGGIPGTDKIQKLMFGTSLDMAHDLARRVALMQGVNETSRGAGSSMMATQQITHPAPAKALKGAGWLSTVLGGNVIGRSVLNQYYQLMQKVSTSPGLLRQLEKGMNGGMQDKEAVNQMIANIINTGGMIGAATGESIEQGKQSLRQGRISNGR